MSTKLKAFTIIELLVSMTLTGILVVFAFLGYNQIQKLFINYTVQSKFISDYNQLNNALFLISNQSQAIEKKDDHRLHFISDSNTIVLDINKTAILLIFNSHTDTFDLKTKNIRFENLKLGNGSPSSLIENFECEVSFQGQKFLISLHKEYDASSILNTTLVLLPLNEQP